MPIVTLEEGSIFAGRYKVVRCIAAGGMGAVYEVVHIETDSHRALKVMLPQLLDSDDMRERFRREARVAAQIKSAHIVDVFDAGIDETSKMPFLVMELLQGEELGKRLRRVGKLGFEETVGYLWQTALALDKTHRANIVHRDLKPENLFLCDDEDGPPRIKVVDFGIAKIVAEGGTAANATRAMGTPLYMAPEQFKSKSTVSAATDIYALGMMAYTLLVGAPYWADEQASEPNPYAFAGLVMHGPSDPPTLRALRLGVTLPEAFNEWFGQATSSTPEKRFFKATVAIKGLAAVLGVPVPGTTGTTTGIPPSSREPQATSVVIGKTPTEQTPTGQTPTGQTPTEQTPTEQTPPGSQGGTLVLADSASPSPLAEPNTHSSGVGLSSSDPKVASVPSVPRMDTPHTGAPVETPKRGKTVLVVIGAAVVLCAVGIGVFVLGGKNQGVTADVVVPLPVPSATMNAPVVPVESMPVPDPAAPLVEVAVDAGTQGDSGATMVDNAQTTPLATSKKPASVGTSVKRKNTDHIRD